MDRWTGKVAVVTGAGSGIGAEIAFRLANAGLIVVGLEINKENVEKLKLRSSIGQLHAYECDITDEQSVKTAFEFIETTFGGVNILINNAGKSFFTSILSKDKDDSIQHIRRIIDTNLTAAIICTKEAFNILKKTNDIGHIINVCSVHGHDVPFIVTPQHPLNIYSGTKFAIRATTEVLRQELIHLAKNVKISQISPGYVATNLVLNSNFLNTKEYFQSVPTLNVEDIADAILYIIGTPPHVQIHDLIIKPVGEKM